MSVYNTIKEKLMEEGIEIPGEDNPDGSQENPIEAYRGMIYYQNKYYKDPEDNNTYLCTRDRDDKPGEGIALNYLPHELIGHYFQLM